MGDSEATRLVQMKHLVCACTGMPEQNQEWLMEFAHATAETEMQVLSAMRPTTKIGEAYQYSNMLAAAAGFVGGYAAYPKRELGAAYDEAMRTRVFEPLGMKSTTFDYDRALRSNHATPHSEDVDGKVQVGTTAGNRAVVPIRPAAGAWSNAHDVALYVQMELANGKLPNGQRYVSEKNLLARRERQSTPEPDLAYGMGLETNTRYGTPLIHHGGSMFGLRSDMFWLPEHDIGGVILTNADSGRGVRDIYQRKVLEVLFDGKPEADEDLATYAKNRKDHIAKERMRLVVPAAEDAVTALAKRYVSPVLGEISVERKGRTTIFDFGEWKSTVASRKNDDGSISFFTIDAGVDNDELVVAQRDGKRALLINDRQMEYVFLEK
ncbi:serine hydrolase domain-containing protein [Pendulispora rubella]|uniref:serine hydrolase domain-containing protein n=1 Tax=Pendulispora rubella TaxID=2741070 RepID=UPI0030DF31D8